MHKHDLGYYYYDFLFEFRKINGKKKQELKNHEINSESNKAADMYIIVVKKTTNKQTSVLIFGNVNSE